LNSTLQLAMIVSFQVMFTLLILRFGDAEFIQFNMHH